MISLITLVVKSIGERSAGNPHAAFDVAGTGNVEQADYCDPWHWLTKVRAHRRTESVLKPARQVSTLLMREGRVIPALYSTLGGPFVDPLVDPDHGGRVCKIYKTCTVRSKSNFYRRDPFGRSSLRR